MKNLATRKQTEQTQKTEKTEKEADKQESVTKEVFYTKEQLVTAKKYAHRIDLLNVILKSEKQYTTKQVDQLMKEFLKRRVK